MTANDLRHDTPEPDPPTPEERYDDAMRGVRYGPEHPSEAVPLALDALRDMIAGLDAEVARLTETVNRQERGQR